MSEDISPLGTDRLTGSGDDIYADLLAAHDGLSVRKSARLNARLVLLLANELGDSHRIRAAIKRAADGLR